MKIGLAGLVRNNKVLDENLMLYLSKVVLTKTNDRVKIAHQEYLNSKSVLLDTVRALKDTKKEFVTLTKELSRIKTLKRVISLIYTLKKEGVLIGNNRLTILDLLDTLMSRSFSSLRSIEESLSVYLPDHRTNSSYIR